MRIPYLSLLAASALALGGCAGNLGGLGVGIGYGGGYGGYDGYGPYGGYGPYYGGSYGYGYGSSYGYGSRYGGYGYGYDDPWYRGYRSPYGWYGSSYYPGTGYYVYDRYRRPRTWSDTERRYWMSRQQAATSTSTTTSTSKATRVSSEPNWSRFEQRAERRRTVRERRNRDGNVVPNQE
jgi:hypothetical protein